MTTTPPLSAAVRTPPTPRHGPRYDNYEPYSPRRSRRIAGQQSSPFTRDALPDTLPDTLHVRAADLLKEHALRRGQTAQQQQVNNSMNDSATTLSPPHSQHNSPTRRPARQDMSSRLSHSPQPHRSRARLLAGSAASSSLPPSHGTMDPSSSTTSSTGLAANGMLPTPAKTPRKKKIDAELGSTARTLFSGNLKPSDDPPAMTPRRSRSKKYTGFSLESFEADPQQAGRQAISIFTDSRDRIPTVNDSPDNPFRSQPAAKSSSTADGTKRRKIDDGRQKRDKNVDKAVHRDDGLLYVFRGKKTFRKFKPEPIEDEGDDEPGLLASRSERVNESMPRIRPLTRSSIKPRVLFPEATAAAASASPDADEPATPSTIIEADQQIEQIEQIEQVDAEDAETEVEGEEAEPELVDPPTATDATTEDSAVDPITPQGQAINTTTPQSPLATGRSLRSHTIAADPELHDIDDASSQAPAKRYSSPFDRWFRGKSQATSVSTRTRKRAIEGQHTSDAKKSRSH